MINEISTLVNDFISRSLLSFMHKIYTAYIAVLAILLTSTIQIQSHGQLVNTSEIITPNNTNPLNVDNGSLLFDNDDDDDGGLNLDTEDDNDNDD